MKKFKYSHLVFSVNCLLISICLVLTAVADVPTQTEIAKLTANDGHPGSRLGSSVSVSGNLAVIGDYRNDENGWGAGAAYIFRWNGSIWTQEAKLTASDASGYSFFGHSVSIDGDRALIGATLGNNSTGAAYVFRWNGLNWVEEAKLISSDAAGYDAFGISVSISGNAALIGASNKSINKGAAYIFRRNGNNWVEELKIIASDLEENDWFGHAVSLSGDRALIGAWADDDNGNESGSAYIFKKEGSNWFQEAKIIASDGDLGDNFGVSVSLNEDIALVGAFRNSSAQGSAYIFRRNGSNWNEEKKLVASDGQMGDKFGSTVAIENYVALVGTPYDDNDNNDCGSAYIYQWDGTDWVEHVKLIASDAAEFDTFGASVAVSADIAIIGASGVHDNNGWNYGAAYAYQLIITGIDEPPDDSFPEIPRQFSLFQNYPNPFNPSTNIRYDLSKTVNVLLKIYNILGQEVKMLVNETQTTGEKSVVWDGRDNSNEFVSSGIYIYRIQAGNYVQSRKIMLLR